MRSWYSLYKKELSALSFFALVTFLVLLAWEVFLRYKMPSWPRGLPFGLAFIPFSVYPLLMLGLGYTSFRQEWKDDTIYFVLSLPRTGWQIALAKLTAALTFFVAITLANIFLIYFLQLDFIRSVLAETPDFILNDLSGYIINVVGQGLLFYLLSGTTVYIVTQFSQLLSRFFNRFKGLISIVIFILTNYVIFRGGSILAPLFKWFPDLPIRIMDGNQAGIREFTVMLGSAPLVASGLIIIGIFITGAWLLENHLEV